jgi:hypothetical protein
MIDSPASSGAKRLIQRCEINLATPLPESRINIGYSTLAVNDSSCRIKELLTI